MSNVININRYKKVKRLEKRLKDTRLVLKATKTYYAQIQPLFKYKMMYDMGREIMQYRKDLLFCIKEINKELKDDL